jgi:FAD/FMN-containing dehydrogenase
LFIGAEGTLGIITAAVVKLFPRPKSVAIACIAVRDPAAAVALLAHLRARCGDTIDAFEFIARSSLDLVFKHIADTHEPFLTKYEWLIITRLTDVLPAALDGALRDTLQSFGPGVAEFEVTTDSAYAERWWKLRKNVAEAQKAEGLSIKHDISVPISRVAEFLEQANDTLRKTFPGIRIVAFGHMGDGNIHYNISMPDAAQNKTFMQQHEQEVRRMVHDITAGLDGSVAAEHGVGQLKRNELPLYKSEVEMELMRSIKKMLDPNGLMNPGKVV